MDLIIQSLDAGRLQDFLDFFDTEAFRDNRDWSECYCQFYYYAPGDPRWEELTVEENRAQACENVRGGRMQGYLAYLEGKVVGWCNAGPKTGYPRLMGAQDFRGGDDGATCSIVCFVVDSHYRRQGIAGRLLRHVCADAKARGISYVEAYPRPGAETDAGHYHGPPPLYEGEGFTLHRDLGSAQVVRLDLG